MTVDDFAKYVIDNMHRASISNALNIATKIDTPNMYSFEDFVNSIIGYVDVLLYEQKIGKIKAYKILVYSHEYMKDYKSEFRYNKVMLIDNYVISLWEALSDDKQK